MFKQDVIGGLVRGDLTAFWGQGAISFHAPREQADLIKQAVFPISSLNRAFELATQYNDVRALEILEQVIEQANPAPALEVSIAA
jgi:signal-transduction protein with cAMP-binding, CBS, and nucleotidyltransferase domain